MDEPSIRIPAPTLLRAAHPVEVAGPSGFLARFRGGARGFWGREDRWVAWAGTLAELRVEGHEAASGRFDAVRAAAREVLSGVQDNSPLTPPRFFGGFSFLADPGTDPVWDGFPAARFVLPRVLLESRPEGARVVVQALASEETSGADLEAEARTLAIALSRDGREERSGDPSPAGEAEERAPEAGWAHAVESVLDAVRAGGVRKAVLARTSDIALPERVAIPRLIHFLRHENHLAHVFLFEPDPGRAFFGAAPEILAEVRAGRFHATAVAGSAPRGVDPAGDRELAAALLASPKDRREHRLTVDEMREVLHDRLSGFQVSPEPRVLTLARIQHLETPMEGRLLPGEDALSLVAALHPTPAVCGRPRARALALIRAAERFDRGWYAGPVGWFDLAGDGDFVPALRAGVGEEKVWRLFAGAGIVEGSDPHLEWDETSLKFEPAVRALRAGLDGTDKA